MFWFKKRKLDMTPLFWVAMGVDNRSGKTIPLLHPLLLSRLEHENVDMWIDDIEQILRGTDIRKSILEIIKAYPTTIPLLRNAIEKKYPQHLDYLKKLIVLV